MTCMSYSASSVAPHSSDVVCAWQQSCTSLSPVETSGALQTQWLPVSSANSFAVQRLSCTIHCSLMAKDMSMWTDMQCPLQCMAALDTIPPANVCTHHESVQYGTARSPSVSKTFIWHSDSAAQNCCFHVQQTLPNFPNKTANAMMFTHKMCMQSSW